MNVTVYREAYEWLFSPAPPGKHRLWSFGRHEPPCGVGDDLLFRLAGKPVARAVCRGVSPPGEFDVEKFDGSRTLKGWKLIWLQRDFEDLREQKLPAMFGKPRVTAMEELLFCASITLGRIAVAASPAYARALKGMIDRGLAVSTAPGHGRLNWEGWRAALRVIDEPRMKDLQNGEPVCRICGCTPNSACEGGCSWTRQSICSRCDVLPVPEEVLA